MSCIPISGSDPFGNLSASFSGNLDSHFEFQGSQLNYHLIMQQPFKSHSGKLTLFRNGGPSALNLPDGLSESDRETLRARHQVKQSLEEQLKSCKDRYAKELEVIQDAIIKVQKEFGEVYNTQSAVLRKLPNDVLGYIFQYSRQGCSVNGAKNLKMEVTVSHVCARWRSVALSMHSLWNVFRHTYDLGRRRLEDSVYERFEAYIKRSHQYPLDIWLDFTAELSAGGNIRGTHRQILHRVFDSELHRCRSIQVKVANAWHVEHFIWKMAPASVPLLEYFDIHITRGELPPRPTFYDGREWAPTVFNGGSPSLKHIRFNDLGIFQIRPPLDCITHLQLEQAHPPPFMFGPNVLETVFSLPHLETLSIYGEFFLVTPEEYELRHATPPIEANALKHFRCGEAAICGGFMPLYFLSHVAAPEVETLAFHCVTLGLVLPENVLLNSRLLTFPKVHTLSIVDMASTNSQNMFMQGLGNLTPNLKRLIFSSPPNLFAGTLEILADHFHPATSETGEVIELPIWRELEEVVLNHLLLGFNTYEVLVTGLPKLKMLFMPSCTKERLIRDVNWFIPDGVTVATIDPATPILPRFWPPGTEREDDDDCPFVIKYKVEP